MGQRCPYPELFNRLRSARSDVDGSERDRSLPVDDAGLCLFHSRDVAWKRENDFAGRFEELLELLDADQDVQYYDFTEFVFIGNAVGDEADGDRGPLVLRDRTFSKAVSFLGASFLDSVELAGLEFLDTTSFEQATFERELRVDDTTFHGVDFIRATLKSKALFSQVVFLSFALFDSSCFSGKAAGRIVSFDDSRFDRITDFSHIVFDLGGEGTVSFRRVDFADVVDFTETVFRCQVCFERVSFASIAEFIDTSFEMVSSTARFRGAAVELNRIEVKEGAVLTFKSTDGQKKLFDHDVQMSFSQEPAGVIRFENVNFAKLTPESRERLMRLEPSGKVEIGAGCIKYRFQTEVRSIPVSQGNTPLVLELCQTFASYFTVSNGINLGFEVVERSSEQIRFFYFTDEDISQKEFEERLQQAETGLWNLLSVRSTGQLMALEGSTGERPAVRGESTLINAIDGISALIGTFFRVGARIALGGWREEDTKALLGAIRFNDAGADQRARRLHQVIVEKYTGNALFGINTQQNEPLPLVLVPGRPALPDGRVRILFLSANARFSPLALEREVRKVRTNLKMAKERDNIELKHECAVTVESLMQAMVDESPSIVHFSGHGQEAGIVLQDEDGNPRLVTSEALSSLFEPFEDTVRCVVLCSCYSIHQAQAIRKHVPHVVGMSAGVPDSAAIAFSTGFYKAIGAGRDVPFAFKLGKAAIELDLPGSPAADLPVLL